MMMWKATSRDQIKEFQFIRPSEKRGYLLFCDELEDDDTVCFHGTAEANLDFILRDGFKPKPPLTSVSFARKSRETIAFASTPRGRPPRAGCVLIVRFERLDLPGIKVNPTDVWVFNPQLLPAIEGYCIVPADYEYV